MFYFENLEQFDAVFKTLYTNMELKTINYDALSVSDKTIFLDRAESFLDSSEMPYKGSYQEPYQQHAFPRVLGTGYVVEKDDERVSKAVCCVVYDLLKSETSSSSSREDLIRQGVKSISTGGVSESYGTLEEVKTISDEYVKYLGFCLFNGVL